VVRNVLIAVLEWLAIWNCRALTPLRSPPDFFNDGANQLPKPGVICWYGPLGPSWLAVPLVLRHGLAKNGVRAARQVVVANFDSFPKIDFNNGGGRCSLPCGSVSGCVVATYQK
jgi:hypothetical protein